MSDIARTLAELGIRPYTPEELSTIANAFKQGLVEKKHGLKMLPSYLTIVQPAELPTDKTALIIETGGSNVYVGLVSMVDGMAVLSQSHKAALPSRTYDSARHYFETIAELAAPILSSAKPDALGVVWAGPIHSEKRDVGNDAKVEALTKEFVIPDVYDRTIIEMTREYIGGKYAALKTLPAVVLNDTVAVLFSCGAQVGGVVGTGMNYAVSTPDGIVNTEAGSFNGFPVTGILKKLDESSAYPGEMMNEKATSGLYLPEQFKLAIAAIQDTGYGIEMPEVVDAEALSGYAELATPTDHSFIATQLFTTSAQLVGTEIGVALATYHANEDNFSVPVEGSLFWGAPGYVDMATKAASAASGKTVKFVNIPHAGRLGAGAAALGTLLQK